jgi:hypothetical protein
MNTTLINQTDSSGNDSNLNDPYQLMRREWPDGRQFSYMAFNIPFENPDGTLGFRTPGDIDDMMAQLNKDSLTRNDGSQGTLAAQKIIGVMEETGTEVKDDFFLRQQREQEQRLETQRQEDARRLEEQRLEQVRRDEAAALEKKRQDDLWYQQHRPQEEAENRALLAMPLALAGLQGTLLMVTSGIGGPLAGLRSLLGLGAVGTMLATAEGTVPFVPGQAQTQQSQAVSAPAAIV